MSIHVYCDGDRSRGDDRALFLRANWADGGELDFVERRQSDGIPAHEWHGHAELFALPVQGVTERDWGLLQEALAPLVGRVVAGYESRWNGNNHVAEFSADAEAAREQIRREIEGWQYDEVAVWQADDWLSAATCARDADGQQCAWGSAVRFDIGDDQITPEADDEMLSALAMKLAGEAGENEIVVGLDDYLSKLRDEARANAEE